MSQPCHAAHVTFAFLAMQTTPEPLDSAIYTVTPLYTGP